VERWLLPRIYIPGGCALPETDRVLKGKVALITGAGRGIGRDIALGFSAQGASVALTARTLTQIDETAAEVTSCGGKAIAIAGDVSRQVDVENVVARTIEAFGRIDVLVNNAGVITPIGPIWELDPEEWLQTIQINLFGTFLYSRSVIPGMIERRAGKIVNLSGAGDGMPNFTAYSTSKVAVTRLTETLAGEVAQYNIQVNAIAPGAVKTQILQDVLDAGDKAGGKQLGDAQKAFEAEASSAKAVELATYLASDASGELTGKLISARWDDWPWDERRTGELTASDLYTLRRKDGR
jgi:3-oxoacyl-[acyl-carrier protein] reductase